MENKKVNSFLKISAILIVVVAIAIIISYSIEYSKINKLKKSYSELEIKYEEALKTIKLYENNKTKKDSNKLEVNNITSNVNLGNLNINGELVQNLYSKILKSNDGIMDAFEGSFYKEEKTTLNNLSNEEKLVIIIKNLPDKEFINFENLDESIALKLGYNPNQTDNYQHIHKDTIQVYSTEEIMSVAQKIFGPNVKLNIVDFSRISS